MKPKSFKTQKDFRNWLEKHHASERELIMRLFKVSARERGIGYREALDEALCYGWIDGVRRALDEVSFTQRFTPRKPKSNWSAVNIRRAGELIAEGRMRPSGRAAFDARDLTKPAPYSHESRQLVLAPAFAKRLRANARARAFFEAQPAWYRRTTVYWIMSAKREETRARRFAALLERSAKGQPIAPLARKEEPGRPRRRA